MKNFLRFCLSLFLFVFVSCTASEGGGTTVANPPTLPQNSFSPDFDTVVPETSVEVVSTSSENAYLEKPATSSALTGVAAFWTDTVLDGSFALNRTLRRAFERYATALATAVNNEAGFELSSDLRVITLSNQTLFNSTGDWRISIGTRDSGNVRVVIRDSQERIWGYYLFQTDSDGNPIRGTFAFANVDAIADSDATALLRFFTLSYDVTDLADVRLSLTSERYDSDLARTVLQNSFYQCDSTAGSCVAELLKITSAQPTREFSSRSIRLSWSETDHQVCAATISYDTVAHLGETQGFVGPDAPDEAGVTAGECEIPTAYWSSRVYAPSNFPNRLNDDSNGGFAVQLFGEGILANWETTLTESSIDDWLAGQF